MFNIDCFYDQSAVVSNRKSVDCFWWGDHRLSVADKCAGLFKAKEGDLFGPAAFNLDTAKRWAAAVRRGDHVFAMLDNEIFPNWGWEDILDATQVLNALLPEVQILNTPTLGLLMPPMGFDYTKRWFDEGRIREQLRAARPLVEATGCAWVAAYLMQKYGEYGLQYSLDAIARQCSLIRSEYGYSCMVVAWCSTAYVFPEFDLRTPGADWATLPREPVTADDVSELYSVFHQWRIQAVATWGNRSGASAYLREL